MNTNTNTIRMLLQWQGKYNTHTIQIMNQYTHNTTSKYQNTECKLNRMCFTLKKKLVGTPTMESISDARDHVNSMYVHINLLGTVMVDQTWPDRPQYIQNHDGSGIQHCNLCIGSCLTVHCSWGQLHQLRLRVQYSYLQGLKTQDFCSINRLLPWISFRIHGTTCYTHENP